MDVFQCLGHVFLESLAEIVVSLVYENPVTSDAFTVVGRDMIRILFGMFDGACESFSDGEAMGT